MLKRSDLPLWQQRELNERQNHLNLMMRPYREQRAQAEVLHHQPSVSGVNAALQTIAPPVTVSAKSPTTAEIWAQSSDRIKRAEPDLAAGNPVPTIHPAWAKSNEKLQASRKVEQ